jgi:hypothetical protein
MCLLVGLCTRVFCGGPVLKGTSQQDGVGTLHERDRKDEDYWRARLSSFIIGYYQLVELQRCGASPSSCCICD